MTIPASRVAGNLVCCPVVDEVGIDFGGGDVVVLAEDAMEAAVREEDVDNGVEGRLLAGMCADGGDFKVVGRTAYGATDGALARAECAAVHSHVHLTLWSATG